MAIYPPPTENPPIFNELDFDKTIDPATFRSKLSAITRTN